MSEFSDTTHESYTYDAANRLLSLTTKKGTTTLSTFTYTSDPLGNRQTTTDAAGLHTYTYDPLSQLTNAAEPAGSTPTLAFLYDPVGNRTQVTRGGTPQAYTPNTLNQYSAVGGTPQTYDANGNLTSDGTATYTFDAESRLTQVVKSGVTTSFTYDALGRRATKTVGGVTTKFLYDGADLLAETNAAGTTITARSLYSPGIDEPLELKRGTTTSSYSADGLGSIAHLTNATGAITEKYTYETFGKLTIKNAAGTTLTTSALGNRFMFTGREWDSETGLYYYRARYYNPMQGRFLSREPLDTEVNLYTYVENNPLTWGDPWGLFSIVLSPGLLFPPGDRVPPPIRIPPGDQVPPPRRFPPGDRGPEREPVPPGDRVPDRDPRPGIIDGPQTKSQGPLQGMDQPGIERVKTTEQGTQEGQQQGDRGNRGRKNTPEEDAVIQLAKEAKRKGGLSPAEAEALKQLGKAAGLDTKDHTNTTHWTGGPHIHVGPIDHIPVR